MMDEYTYIKNAWITCQEMVEDRGFKLDKSYKELSDADFKYLTHEKKLDIYATKIVNDKKCGIYIKFITTLRIKPTLIKNYVDEIREQISDIDILDIVVVLKIEPK